MKRRIRFQVLLPAFAIILSGTALADVDGHCNYVQEGNYGAFKVCQMPADAARCEELGSTGDNHDAVQGDGACSSDGLVGTCDLGEFQLVYYEGDAGGLEVGCGFQGGEWVTP